MASVGMLPTCRLIAILRTMRYKTLGVCSDLANKFPLPVDLYILNPLSYQLTRLQIHYPSSLPTPFWRGQDFQIFHLDSHVLCLRLSI